MTALTFVATLDEVGRFTRAKQLQAYLELVLPEYSSGERLQRGHITKAGNSRVRRLLVECGWNILVRPSESSRELRRWGEKIAGRRGQRVAAMALGRKLAGILFALWRDGESYRSAALSTPMASGS